jgi:DNA-binding MarR family transcriptional regulator/N-acetylglutamate synthase-like GNAT family acetyltransferase
MPRTEDVGAVRAFNRFYTIRFGMLRGGLLSTPHPLTEARILYELGQREVTEVSELRRALEIDAGQLSRLLARLDADGLVTRERFGSDARRRRVRLTAAGAEAFAVLDRRSSEEIAELLEGLGQPGQQRLVLALEAVRELLDGPAAPPPYDRPDVTLRGVMPGDLGWIVERHGVLYAREYGWDATFEAFVARVMGEFDPAHDAAWIAEVGGRRAGCVLCVRRDARIAQLRTLLVEPSARGSGVGSRLVDACVRHARASGFQELSLWTNDVLVEARRLYERAGFRLTHEAPHRAFGHDLVEQTWSLQLN